MPAAQPCWPPVLPTRRRRLRAALARTHGANSRNQIPPHFGRGKTVSFRRPIVNNRFLQPTRARRQILGSLLIGAPRAPRSKLDISRLAEEDSHPHPQALQLGG